MWGDSVQRAGTRRRGDDLAERQRRRQRDRLAARDRLPHRGLDRQPGGARRQRLARGASASARGSRSVALFLESDGDGARLAEALARACELEIGVAVLKVGASRRGASAAAAHTGALAGDQRVFRALIEEAGAAWASEPHELLELARVLAEPRARPSGSGRLAVLTCSGGDSGVAADEAERLGVELASFGPATAERWRRCCRRPRRSATRSTTPP